MYTIDCTSNGKAITHKHTLCYTTQRVVKFSHFGRKLGKVRELAKIDHKIFHAAIKILKKLNLQVNLIDRSLKVLTSCSVKGGNVCDNREHTREQRLECSVVAPCKSHVI